MKANYVKPELKVVDFEINSAISACSAQGGLFVVNDCDVPGDMFGDHPFLEGGTGCTDLVRPSCKHTSMTQNFDS